MASIRTLNSRVPVRPRAIREMCRGWSLPTMRLSIPIFSIPDAQHQRHRFLNQGQCLVVQGGDARSQPAFVHGANLLNSSAGIWGECGQLNQQGPIGWGCGAGQWNDHDGASNSVYFGGGNDDTRPGFGHLRALNRIERDPKHIRSGDCFAHLVALVEPLAACASTHSRSKASRSKSGSHASTESVNSAFTHSSDSVASSGYWFSSLFIRAAASASMRLCASCLDRKSCVNRSTMYRLRCRGGTARASWAAKSSGKRSSTCLGGDV